MMKNSLMALIVSFAVGGALRAAAPADAHPTTAPGKTFTYKRTAATTQQLEVYFPPDWAPGQRRSAIILFHGGGWKKGTLAQFRQVARYFSNRGMVAATANYRLVPETAIAARKRVCITDAKSAIRWMKQQADALGIDPARLVAAGGSAGGHIAVLATMTPGLDDPADPAGFDTTVAAYVLFNPAFDPTDKTDPAVDVLSQVRPGMAPAIFFFGTLDPWRDKAEALRTVLGAYPGNRNEWWIAEGEQHGFFNKPSWREMTLARADRFLATLGLLRGEPTASLTVGNQRLVRAP